MSTKPNVREAMRGSMLAENVKVKDRFATADIVQESGGITGPAVYDIRGADRGAVEIFSKSSTKTDAKIEELLKSGRSPISIPMSSLEENPFNARTFYDEEKVKTRAESIKQYGQLVPALVCPSSKTPGKYTLIDGHYRRKALMYNGATAIDCVVDDSVTNDEALYRYSAELNEEREQQSPLDNAFAWRRLIDSGIASSDEDLRAKGFAKGSKGLVSKTMSLLKLAPSIHSLIQQHPSSLGLHAAYEIVLLDQELGTEASISFARKIVDEQMSLRQAEEYRKLLTQPKEKRHRDISRQYKIKRGNEEVGTLKVSDSGRLQLDVTLNTDEGAELVEELKTRFGLLG